MFKSLAQTVPFNDNSARQSREACIDFMLRDEFEALLFSTRGNRSELQTVAIWFLYANHRSC